MRCQERVPSLSGCVQLRLLATVTVIATDKTGTITENEMQVEHFYFDGKITSTGDFKDNEKAALSTALLASDAIRNNAPTGTLGNPMAQAIQERLKQAHVDIPAVSKDWVLKDELSFDVKRKLASYVYQYGGSQIVLSSGAPEKILENCSRILLRGEESPLTDAQRGEVLEAIAQMARSGERLLAFGYHRLSNDSASNKENLEQDVVFVGIIGFIDPPRKEVKGAIETCQEAGIKVIMITGDHPETAKNHRQPSRHKQRKRVNGRGNRKDDRCRLERGA